MAAISAVSIKGFQSHVESVFNLGPGLNVITGPSDAGKTAIIRAVRWVAFNEPTGEAYVNQSVGEAEVNLLLDTGQIITKRRRKGKTSYLLQQDQGDEGSLFEKAEVPEEVKALLGITKQTFGDFETALNFAFQLDAPFLISETASAGAKVLGKLAGTEAVDLAVKSVNKDTVAARNERSQAEREVQRINGDLLQYAEIDEAKEALDLAEMVVRQIEESYQKGEGLKQLRTSYAVYTDQMERLAEKLDKLADLPALEEDLKEIEKAQLRYDTLLDLYRRYHSLAANLDNLTAELMKYEGVDLAASYVEVISENQDKLSLLNNLYTEYSKYAEVVKKNSEQLADLQHLKDAALVIGDVQESHDRIKMLDDLDKQIRYATRHAEMALESTERFRGLPEAEQLLSGTGAKSERLEQLKTLLASLTSAKMNADRHNNWIMAAEADLEKAQLEQKAAWEAAGGICPLCEQPHEGGAC